MRHSHDPYAVPTFGPYGYIIGARRARAGLPPPPPHWSGTVDDFRRYIQIPTGPQLRAEPPRQQSSGDTHGRQHHHGAHRG